MDIVVALVQEPPVFLDLGASTARAVALIGEAAAGGATLVVFPESWLPGYPVWLDAAPGAALWGAPGAAALFEHLLANAPTVDGPEIALIAEQAVASGVDVALGLHERAGSTLYNATLLLGHDGDRRARRKLVPTFNEKLIWGAGDGSTLATWTRSYGTLGSLICWEHWMPLLRAAMHAQDETIHVAQWPAVGERHQIASRHYAFEGQCVVIASGCVLTRDDVLGGFDHAGGSVEARAMLETIARTEPLLKSGDSAIVAPDATYILPPVGHSRGIVYAPIDLAAVPNLRMAIDTAGHYARPDIFELRVDTRPRRGVVLRAE